jgi:hypothetical protein
MSIFTKSLKQLRAADVQELLQDGAVENARLEADIHAIRRGGSMLFRENYSIPCLLICPTSIPLQAAILFFFPPLVSSAGTS